MPQDTLADRFFTFALRVPGSEAVDCLTDFPAGLQKADLLFRKRSVICEVKTLLTDTKPKIDALLAKVRDSEEWPIYYGGWPLHEVLKRLPEGETLEAECHKAATSALREITRKANRQVRDTRAAYGLANADGVLVILNEGIEILSPDVIFHAVAKEIRKQGPSGKARYEQLSLVVLMSEAHVITLPDGVQSHLTFVIESTLTPPTLANCEFVESSLIQGWAAANGRPSIRLPDATDLASLDYRSTKEATAPLRRSDLWRIRYEQKPNLRNLTLDELIEFGAKTMVELEPVHMKNWPKWQYKPSLAEQRALEHRYSDFSQEISFRKIDLREWGPKMATRTKALGFGRRPS